MTNQITQKDRKNNLIDLLQKSHSLQLVLKASQNLQAEDFVAKVVATVMQNTDLANCTLMSIVSCCIASAQIGLPVDTNGFAYLVPYGGKATLQIGYKGYIALARRSGLVQSIEAVAVYNGEEFKVIQGTNSRIEHEVNIDLDRTYKNLRAVYGVITYTNGGVEFAVMNTAEIAEVKNATPSSKGGKRTFWDNYPLEMAKKTVIKKLLKNCCHLQEVQNALTAENAEYSKQEKSMRDANVTSVDDLVPNEPKQIQDDEIPDYPINQTTGEAVNEVQY